MRYGRVIALNSFGTMGGGGCNGHPTIYWLEVKELCYKMITLNVHCWEDELLSSRAGSIPSKVDGWMER